MPESGQPASSERMLDAERAIAAAALAPGGKLVLVESCVPRWFYAVGRVLFAPLTWLAKTPLLGGNPATLQLPVGA